METIVTNPMTQNIVLQVHQARNKLANPKRTSMKSRKWIFYLWKSK